MRKLIVIFFISLSFQAKPQDSLERKYMMALLTLKSDKVINHQIKYAFYYLDTSVTELEFQVNDQIWFLPLSYAFKFKKSNWEIDSELVKNNNLFKEKFYFEPFKFPLISKLLPPTDSKLLLTFSKPFGNYLLAEILDSGVHSTNTYKTGRAIEFLFVFDEDGLVKEVINNITQYR